MLKRAAIAQRKITSVSKGQGGKCPKLPGPNEEAQKSSVVSSDYYGLSRISLNALPALEGAAQNTSKEACVSLEDGALARGPPNTDQAVSEAPTAETTICFLLQARQFNLAISNARIARLPDRLMLGSYVKPMEWGRPSMDTLALGPNEARSIIDRWNPFNRGTLLPHICANSTPLSSEYRWQLFLRSIPFPSLAT